VQALGGGSHPGIALVIDASGTRGWLFQDLSGGPWINDPNLRSSVLGQVASGGTDEVTFVVEAQDTGNCKTEGRYRWEVSPDGQALTLTTVSDLCTVRRAFLERRWTRSTEQLP